MTQRQDKGVGVGSREFAFGDEFLGFGFDGVELADACESLVGSGRVVRAGVVEVASAVSPAADFDDGVSARGVSLEEEAVVDVVSVGAQEAFVAPQGVLDEGAGMIGGEAEDVEGVIAVAEDRAHLAGGDFARHGKILIGHSCGVSVQDLRLEREGLHGVDDRAIQLGEIAHPGAHRGAGEFDPVATSDAFEAVQRDVIGIFTDGDLGEQAGSGNALIDRLRRQRGDGDALVTLGAGVFAADVLVDEERGGDVVELLGDLFAELLLDAAAAGTEALGLGEFMDDALAAKVFGEGFAAVALAFGLGVVVGSRPRSRLGSRLGSR